MYNDLLLCVKVYLMFCVVNYDFFFFVILVVGGGSLGVIVFDSVFGYFVFDFILLW